MGIQAFTLPRTSFFACQETQLRKAAVGIRVLGIRIPFCRLTCDSCGSGGPGGLSALWLRQLHGRCSQGPRRGPHRRQRVKCGDCLVPPGELAKHGPQMVIPLALAGVLKASWVCMVEQTFDTSLVCFRNLSKRSSGLTPVASAKMLTKSWGLEFQSRLLSGTLISDCE